MKRLKPMVIDAFWQVTLNSDAIEYGGSGMGHWGGKTADVMPYTKSMSKGYRSCPHPQPFSQGRREPHSKSLFCGRGLKAFGI